MGVCNAEKKHKAKIIYQGIIEPVKIEKKEEKNDPPEDKKSETNININSVPKDMMGDADQIRTTFINEMYGNNNNDKQNKVNDEQNNINKSNIMNGDEENNNSGNNINNSKNKSSINSKLEDLKSNENSNNNINNDNNNDNSKDREDKIIDNVSNTPIDFKVGQGSNNDDNSKMNGQSSSFINNKPNTKSLHNSQNENEKIYTNNPTQSINNSDIHNPNRNTNSVIDYKANINVDDQNQNQSNEQKNTLLNNNQNNELPNQQNINLNNEEEDKNQINNISSQNIENNSFAKNNYDNLDINKTYYISCPYCKKYQPYIESIEFDTNENDFLITFICPCNASDDNKKKAYLSAFFVEEEPENRCQMHSNKIAYFCKECQRHTCFSCMGDKHKNHSIYGFDKNKILSKDKRNLILNTIEEKKGTFKGYNIISKLLNELDKNTIYSKQGSNLHSSKEIINSNNNINNNKINQYNSK